MPRGYIQCPRCGAYVDRILPEPSWGSASLEEIAAANRAEGARPCPECGWRLNAIVAPYERLPGAPGDSRSSGALGRKIFGIIALIVAAAVAVWVFLSR